MKNFTENSVDVVNRSKKLLSHDLTTKMPFLNLKLYIVIGICVGICLIVTVVLILLCLNSNRKSRKQHPVRCSLGSFLSIKLDSDDEVSERKGSDRNEDDKFVDEKRNEKKKEGFGSENGGYRVIDIENGSSDSSNSKTISGGSQSSSSASASVSTVSVEVPNLGWGRWYTLRELEIATNGFSGENVIGEGGFGVVYRGVLPDKSVIAVKKLLNKKGQAEKEFEVEVEAIGKVKHKNLVNLIGYCAEGAQRMLVFEYVANGNLDQWLHCDVGLVSPLTWDIRMKIALGTAKGLAYLHEGLEPKVVHRDIKSSNILLDKKWNAKVSDFGLAKLLQSDASYVTTRVMGTFGCVAPDYASTGMLNECSDVYSFGVLLMELISGRSPVDYARPPGEVNLVEWFRGMVASRREVEVVDPLLEVQPTERGLKRVILICLRCIDLDASKRPRMGQVVHMLEADEFPFRSETRLSAGRDIISLPVGAVSKLTDRMSLPTKNAER